MIVEDMRLLETLQAQQGLLHLQWVQVWVACLLGDFLYLDQLEKETNSHSSTQFLALVLMLA